MKHSRPPISKRQALLIKAKKLGPEIYKLALNDQIPPFVTDYEKKIYFWRVGTMKGDIHLSSHPHPLLPHFCNVHGWYSEEPCPADHVSTNPKWAR